MKTKLVFFSCFTLILSIFIGFFSGMAGSYVGSRLFINTTSNSSSNTVSNKQVEVIEENSAYIEVVKKTQSAVVSIIVTADVPVYENYYSNPFGGDGFFDFNFPSRRQVGSEEKQVGAGSGFIVTEDGLIVTNKHVVSDPDAGYTVIMSDGTKQEAEIIGTDQFMDIAILQIEGDDYNFIALGDSDKIQVGQKVAAIGYALGQFSNSVSAGIISGLSRSITASGQMGSDAELLSNVIQTDASINPGNSGGPLLDLSGNAIGVNVAVATSAENIGFAIPINSVKKIVKSVEENGKIVRPYIGVRYVPIDALVQEKNDLKYDYGVLVVKGNTIDELAVIPGSPADKAGILENDIILEVNKVK
ncbi:trypsin-like peptidase domain-containing protein, partial [Candidatus Dojkabacteria bacterium]|nr:trypsin-like peptidase domain-containing protein [Candidatus Dojkabacteria bacterium]